jgi:hypothetical protein
MDDTKRRPSLHAVLAVVAVVVVAAVFWAASALASDGSASSERGARDSPAATTVQDESEAPDEDCPNSGSESESSADG